MKASLYIPARMTTHRPHPKIIAAVLAALAVAVGCTACGTQGIQVAKSSPYHHGAALFLEHCSGCHTLAAVGAEGSATSVKDRVRTNGPNFDFRKEHPAEVLYAIRNGGFSGAIMPQNILVGKAAVEVAQFLAKYAGLQAPKVPAIENTALPGSSTSPTATGAAPTTTGAAGTETTSIGTSTFRKASAGAPKAKAASTSTTASGK
jgi:mono/diheme cytochrome c family protein